MKKNSPYPRVMHIDNIFCFIMLSLTEKKFCFIIELSDIHFLNNKGLALCDNKKIDVISNEKIGDDVDDIKNIFIKLR